jgi:hypothetical protein
VTGELLDEPLEEPLAELLEELGELLAGGVAGREDGRETTGGATGGARPGVLDRVVPPLATARAAAESAALEPGRTGVALFEGAGRDELEEAGGGATGRVASEVGRLELEDDDGRLPDPDEPEELDDPEDAGGVVGGAGDTGGRENADGRDAGGLDAGWLDAGGVEPDELGRLLLEPLLDPDPEPEDGRAGAARAGAAAAGGVGRDDDGRDEAGGVGGVLGRFGLVPVTIGVDTVGAGEAGGRVGGVNADGGFVVGAAALVGASAEAAEPSGRAPAGRTRVVSSATPSLDSVDVTLGDASVVIGNFPPPGICRGVLSGRSLLSELTSQPPCSSSRRGTSMGFHPREPLGIRQQGPQDPPVWPILASPASSTDSSPQTQLDRKCPQRG